MRLTILTIGSTGDVLPFIALSLRLKQAGHSVRVVTFRNFENFVRGFGLDFSPLAGDPQKMIADLISVGANSFNYFPRLAGLLAPVREEVFNDLWQATENTDAVIYSILGGVIYSFAEKKGLPCFRSFFCPMDSTRDFPVMTAPILPFGPLYHQATWWMGERMWMNFSCQQLNLWRTRMGLAPFTRGYYPYRQINGHPLPTLYAYSQLVAPKPHEWNEHMHLTGYWFLDQAQDWQPGQGLAKFLEAGSPPVYVGFGSMVGQDFRPTVEIVLKALEMTGQRGVLSSGWGGLTSEDLPGYACKVDYVPHDWLFKRVSLAIHHGGAGTTGASLRAGKPTLIVPFGGDQAFWGKQIARLGVGPAPIPRRKLSVDRLARAIDRAVNDAGIARRAASLGQQLRAEDGVQNAVDLIEMYLAKTP